MVLRSVSTDFFTPLTRWCLKWFISGKNLEQIKSFCNEEREMSKRRVKVRLSFRVQTRQHIFDY